MERIVVLRSGDPIAFVADSCHALAGAVNEVRVLRPTDAELINTYAEFVIAYARLMQSRTADERDANIRNGVIDHFAERVRQARAGEIDFPFDAVDRLHAEITRYGAPISW